MSSLARIALAGLCVAALPGAALAGKYVSVRDAVLRDRVFQRGLDVFLADQLGKSLGPVLAGDDLVHAERGYARPRVIRGTQVEPLPLLPSGPGGVRGRPLHEARSLTFNASRSAMYQDVLPARPALATPGQRDEKCASRPA